MACAAAAAWYCTKPASSERGPRLLHTGARNASLSCWKVRSFGFLGTRRCVAERSKGSKPSPVKETAAEVVRDVLENRALNGNDEDKPSSLRETKEDVGELLDKKALHGSTKVSVSSTNYTAASEEETENVAREEKTKTKAKHNIIFVTAEAAPYSKTGGLGDVCGSLPVVLAARGHRVMVVTPRYLNGVSDEIFARAVDIEKRIKIPCFGGEQEVAFFHEYRAGVDWVFVDHPSYHRAGSPYGDGNYAFGDNVFRFTLLCHAACEAPLVLPLGGCTYGEKCLFLVHDWHASLVPVLLGAKYRPHNVYKDARSILVIHNLAHQGVEPATTYLNLGLPPEWYGALGWIFPTWARTHALDTGEAINLLKGAIVTADRIVTVSQGYAWEITTIEGGHGLNELLHSRKSVLNGITNGINIDDWDPAKDKHIAFHYSVDDLSGKSQCKAALQKELGLFVRPNCPLIGFVGRLDYQKGTDLIVSALPEILQDDIQFWSRMEASMMLLAYQGQRNKLTDIGPWQYVDEHPIIAKRIMLGSGDRGIEEMMRSAEFIYREKFRGWVGFNIPISHQITAGCDILLMPSRFEPCGLNQLYAMRYGTVPVVHSTGGLKDTVENFDPFANEGKGQGTGWAFSPLSKENMLGALRIAIQTYREHKPSWEGLMKRGMTKDFTWESSAVQYELVFEWAFVDPPYVG